MDRAALAGADMLALYGVLGIAAIVLVWWLIRAVQQSSHRLDQRIGEYHEQGPPADPYAELARLLAEDDASRPRGFLRRRGGKQK